MSALQSLSPEKELRRVKRIRYDTVVGREQGGRSSPSRKNCLELCCRFSLSPEKETEDGRRALVAPKKRELLKTEIFVN